MNHNQIDIQNPPALKKVGAFRVAFESVVWGLRIDDLDYMLKVLQACGYQGVEISQSPKNIFVKDDDGTPRDIGGIDQLIERCERYGMTLTGLVGGTLEDRVAYIGNRRNLYLYLDSWPEDAWKYLVQPNPIRLAIHPHWFMPIRKRKHVEDMLVKVTVKLSKHYRSEGHSDEDAKRLTKEALQNLRLIVDTAHAVIAEDDPVRFVTDHAERLEAVHVKG